MKPCTFADFLAACAHRLTESQIQTLDSEAPYYQIGDSYCSLLAEPERVWVASFVGGIRGIWELKKELIDFPLVGWKCRPESPMHKIAKYYGATIENADAYPDGVISLRCLLYTRQTRRLQNTKEKSQGLT